MNEKLTKLSEPLAVDEIQFRIKTVKDNKGFSLLAYKTARVDTKRLNENFGMNWKNKYFYDNKGNLCCEISIYNNDIKEWVGRSDVGKESYTEKEKGLYSDSFKRAAVKWGIGQDLYNFPFVWINWSDWSQYNGKSKPKFNVSDMKVDKYVYQDNEVKELVLSYKGSPIYKLEKNVEIRLLNSTQISNISELLYEHNLMIMDLVNQFGVTKVSDIHSINYNKCLQWVEDAVANIQKA